MHIHAQSSNCCSRRGKNCCSRRAKASGGSSDKGLNRRHRTALGAGASAAGLPSFFLAASNVLKRDAVSRRRLQSAPFPHPPCGLLLPATTKGVTRYWLPCGMFPMEQREVDVSRPCDRLHSNQKAAYWQIHLNPRRLASIFVRLLLQDHRLLLTSI